jgi:hypothetical protein
VVVIDVAMTETARLADYVLPAPTQFEKWEATFFNFEFPRNVFHLRRPCCRRLTGRCPSRRSTPVSSRRSACVTCDAELAPLREAAERGRAEFAQAFFAATAADPALGPSPRSCCTAPSAPHCPTVPRRPRCCGVRRTAAPGEPDGVRRAGFGEGLEAGERCSTRSSPARRAS